MSLSLMRSVVLLVTLSGAAQTFEVRAKIIKIDTEKSAVVVAAGGQMRTVRVAKDAKFFDDDGKELKEGLQSKKLEGAEATLTVERDDNEPVIKAIRLGKPPAQGQSVPNVDTSTFKPLTELGKGKYKGFPGGLYPDGSNERPAAHEAAGIALARKVQPLDAEGKPSAQGKIVLLTVGMSNTSQASEAFKRLADTDPEKSLKVVIVNGAQGGMVAAAIQDPNDNRTGTRYWTTVDERLQAAGVTRAQVQVVWIKQADAGPNQGFPQYAQKLQGELARIAQILPARFPNVKLAYLSSRIYGGYAKTPLNPEPYAYESGFSVNWLIEQQLKGELSLNYDPKKGEVKVPWLSWGPYLWANGMTKRADGLFYDESDLAGDGTHESPSGQRKVGTLLLQFFKSDTTTRDWFVKK